MILYRWTITFVHEIILSPTSIDDGTKYRMSEFVVATTIFPLFLFETTLAAWFQVFSP